MRLSRFFLVPLGVALTLSLARCTRDRGAPAIGQEARVERVLVDSLAADSSAVEKYLSDDAHKRVTELTRFASGPEVGAGLTRASGAAKIDRETRLGVKAALRHLAAEVPAELKFDAVWAVDAGGRVVADVGFEHGEDWELGGYPAVADATLGWIRDDAWVWRGRIYRVVMRPVEREAQGEPVGAIIGGNVVDDAFARSVARRTGAAVGFYVDGARVAAGAPEGFDKASLDEISRDLKALEQDKSYQEQGRSEVRLLGPRLGVVYARLPGEARELGAGYAVARLSGQ